MRGFVPRLGARVRSRRAAVPPVLRVFAGRRRAIPERVEWSCAWPSNPSPGGTWPPPSPLGEGWVR